MFLRLVGVEHNDGTQVHHKYDRMCARISYGKAVRNTALTKDDTLHGNHSV